MRRSFLFYPLSGKQFEATRSKRTRSVSDGLPWNGRRPNAYDLGSLRSHLFVFDHLTNKALKTAHADATI
jgi:hypothetical protein